MVERTQEEKNVLGPYAHMSDLAIWSVWWREVVVEGHVLVEPAATS